MMVQQRARTHKIAQTSFSTVFSMLVSPMYVLVSPMYVPLRKSVQVDGSLHLLGEHVWRREP